MNRDITVEQLKQRLDQGEEIVLLDVRESHEREYANIGGQWIPLSLVPLKYQELDPKREIVVYCHHGSRSMAAVNFLAGRGFNNVKNLAGGIDAWSVKIDPKVKRY